MAFVASEPKARTTRSAFSSRLCLFFRDVFDVVDVGSGLRQNVVQVVANADEGESLVEELADARRSE